MDMTKGADTNWYVLFTTADRQSQLCGVLHTFGLDAFFPMVEYYRRDQPELAVKPWFPGYVFVRSEWDQLRFDLFLQKLGRMRFGTARQLKDEGKAALRPEEIRFITDMTDQNHVVRMSYGTQVNKKTRVTKGPLRKYQDRILKVDAHDRYATLSLKFMDRNIRAGLTINRKIMM